MSMQWDDVHKSVNAVWIGFFNTAEFREAATRLVEEIKARNATSTINDIRKLEGVIHTDQLWIRDTWVPLAQASALKRIGVVVALHGLAKFAADAMVKLVGIVNIQTRFFNSFDDAIKWVDAEDKQSKTPT